MAALHSNIARQQAREDRQTVTRALQLLEGEMRKPGKALNGTGAARQFLTLSLAGYDREVFSALWLDAQHRLIMAEHLAVGTLTQTSVFPREVIKQALAHNAAAVIFAHNHPSGCIDPSHADLILTRALMDALALVDMRVLDHFIVAGTEAASLAEMGLLGLTNFPPKEKQSKPANKGATKPMQERAQERKQNTLPIGSDVLTVRAHIRGAFALLKGVDGYGSSGDLCDVGFALLEASKRLDEIHTRIDAMTCA